jgi:hypothetical protein
MQNIHRAKSLISRLARREIVNKHGPLRINQATENSTANFSPWLY